MDPTRGRRAGFTLLETLVVAAMIGVLAAIAAPAARHAADRAAARGARDGTAIFLSRARAEAPARGGAHLAIDLESASLMLRGGRPGAHGAHFGALDLRRRYGVRVQSRGVETGSVDIVFDAYGIGRIASRSLTFRRGAAEAGLTVSSYGRVRRW
ncbi:MAG TPA: prepilin-type N-terminal cleavage/methylation domain-containing protein [Longimicrobiales bacterium]|nr:prepilin-type N-terminal cleavage/methylation domain-containing protein [Longimicrobiales bacterium]